MDSLDVYGINAILICFQSIINRFIVFNVALRLSEYTTKKK